jgi:hypothetical protein
VPIAHDLLPETGVLHTRLIGTVTDAELLDYYRGRTRQGEGRWKELVDGREITKYAITAEGQRALAQFASGHVDRLRGGRVAMVAASDVTFGMFRMWQLQREGLGYEVAVFRDFDRAMTWLTSC